MCCLCGLAIVEPCGAPASPNKLASKYLYERSTLKEKVSRVITLHHRVRDGIPERDGFKTTLFFSAVAVPFSHGMPAVLEPILKYLARSVCLS